MKKIDSLRIWALLVILLTIVYYNLNLFAPRFIPSFLRIGSIRYPTTVLILGSDITFSAETGKPIAGLEGRTDTILLVRLDPIKDQIRILSIPRDSLVMIPGYGMAKVNAANVYGGIPLLKQTLFKLLRQDIDYYFEINPAVIKKIVDIAGGVTIDVEKDMRYVDHAQGLDINLKKGKQKLSGQQAHDYIRFRYDAMGDIGRVERQQNFLKALAKTLRNPSIILKLPFAMGTALTDTKTDLSVGKAVRILNFVRMVSPGNIKTITLSGEATTVPYAGSVLIPNKTALEEVVKECF